MKPEERERLVGTFDQAADQLEELAGGTWGDGRNPLNEDEQERLLGLRNGFRSTAEDLRSLASRDTRNALSSDSQGDKVEPDCFNHIVGGDCPNCENGEIVYGKRPWHKRCPDCNPAPTEIGCGEWYCDSCGLIAPEESKGWEQTPQDDAGVTVEFCPHCKQKDRWAECDGKGEVFVGSPGYGSPGESYAPCAGCPACRSQGGPFWTPRAQAEPGGEEERCVCGHPAKWHGDLPGAPGSGDCEYDRDCRCKRFTERRGEEDWPWPPLAIARVLVKTARGPAVPGNYFYAIRHGEKEIGEEEIYIPVSSLLTDEVIEKAHCRGSMADPQLRPVNRAVIVAALQSIIEQVGGGAE